MAKILIAFLLLLNATGISYASDIPKALNIPLHTAAVSLNPSGIQDISSLFVSRQVNCQLVREQGTIYTLEAAESIKYISPLEVIIKIKKDVSFHDGSPITANDIISSFNFIKNSRNTLRNIFNWVKDMSAIDNNTVRIRLNKPIPQFLKVLSAPNYAIFKANFTNEAKSNDALWAKPLGCGKYKVSEISNSIIKLLPVHDGYPINFHLTSSNQLTPSQIQSFDITDLQIDGQMGQLPAYRVTEIYDPTQIFIGLNSNKAPWNDKKSRCSFLSKLDANAITEKYGTVAKSATDYFPQGVLGYSIKYKYMSNILNENHNKPPHLKSFCLDYLAVSIPEMYRGTYHDAVSKIYPHVTTLLLKDTKRFGPDFQEKNCDVLILGLKSNYLDGYEYLVTLSEKNANYTGYKNEYLANQIRKSQNIVKISDRFNEYRNIVSKIENLCLMRPLVTITMRKIYIKNELKTPDIGAGPLNEYDLSKVT